jgi:hypothetical protein
MNMRKLAVVLMMAGVLAACETTTVRDEQDTAPTTGMMMSPPNEKGPAQPIDRVTDPGRQIPTNTPGRY